MPLATRDGVQLNWRSEGSADAPALLLLNSLGTDLAMWDGVVPSLAREFRVIRMDTRGHGASGAPHGDYSIPELADDALAVLDAASARRAHVCGLSMGGMIALELGLRASDRVAKVVVCNSSAEVAAEPWQTRAATVREGGMGRIVDAVMERFFSPSFRQSHGEAVAAARKTFVETSPEGYASCCMAISRVGLLSRLDQLHLPTLVVNGALDEATPPKQHGERIAAAVDGAETAVLDAGHLSAIEQPEAFAEIVSSFLRR